MKNLNNTHTPVLLNEVVQLMNLKNGMTVVDGTLGAGGHSREIIKRIMPDGLFVGIDLDSDFLAKTKLKIVSEFPKYKDNIHFVQGNYANIANILGDMNIKEIDGMVVDLGFSSWHIFESARGFTFNSDEILDMRYDISMGVPAYQVINGFSQQEIADILLRYGEEKFADRISKAIMLERKSSKIITADHLRKVIVLAVPNFYTKRKIDPSTKTFQALRIYVNQELDNLQHLLDKVGRILKPNGRLLIISFHSMEDRLVKYAFRNMERLGKAKLLTKKPITASAEEIRKNSRSRSAKLRGVEIIKPGE